MRSNYATLTDLAMEIDRIEKSKNDYLIPSTKLTMFEDNYMRIEGESDFGINEIAHSHLSAKLNIPKAYYDRMAEVEGLRSLNVNAWLRREPKKNFVRTLDGNIRGFLSSAFRPIDNFDVMTSVLPVIGGMNVDFKSTSLTDKKLYLQVTFPEVEREVKKGDIVTRGFILTNSEVGHGAVDIKFMIWRLICQNGMIGQSILRKFHVGSRINTENQDIFKDDTVKAELESFKLRLRDIMAEAVSIQRFEDEVNKLKSAVDDKITNINDTVQNITKRFGISQGYNDSIIQNMVEESNLNRYGLANGITALAHKIENPDIQYEVEKIGSMIINMTRNEWGKYQAA